MRTVGGRVVRALLGCASALRCVQRFHRVGLDLRDRRRTAAFVRDITAAKDAEEHQNPLIAELDHRVKNALARVAAIARRTGETSDTIEELVTTLDGRIRSMANARALLSRSHSVSLVLSATGVRCHMELTFAWVSSAS
jgi:hypothetical protein